MQLALTSLDIDPALYFRGSNEEIAEAEAKEAARAAEIERIIFSDDFIQLTYRTDAGAIRSLHKSTRPGVMFQLSYIAPDGVPAMHESFIQTAAKAANESIHSKSQLTEHFIRATLNKSIQTEITYA